MSVNSMMKWFAMLLAVAAGAAQAAPPAPITTWFHNDLTGSPVAATNAVGQVIWREGYYPFGERLLDPLTDNRVWFTSRRQDPETGLLYMGARYYDPVAGRFLQPDPVHFVESNVHSFNRYAYANNNPYKFKDPDGREAYVIYHPAAIKSDLNPNNHTSILLVPNNPADFSDKHGWRISMNGDSMIATLGAQPLGASTGIDRVILGNLVAAPNFPGDAPANATGGVWLPPPSGMTDTQWINALIGAAQAYQNDRRYMPLPESTSGSYNSNSFVSGVIQRAGGNAPSLPVRTPGYHKPVPIP